MKNLKIVAILVATMLIGLTTVSTVGAVELEGEINVEISQFVGLVVPEYNIADNQEGLSFKVDKIGDRYFLNDTLSIKIKVTDNSGRDEIRFLIPRYLYTSIFIVRDMSKIPLFPLIGFPGIREGLLQRLVPIRITPFSLKDKTGRVDVTKGNTSINITMNYELQEGVTSENLVMHIFTMGLLPGNTNGIGEKLPIIAHKKVNLSEVTYNFP